MKNYRSRSLLAELDRAKNTKYTAGILNSGSANNSFSLPPKSRLQMNDFAHRRFSGTSHHVLSVLQSAFACHCR